MDKDIREFLDRAEQNRLYEEKRKRKEKRLANHIKRQKRKAEILFKEIIPIHFPVNRIKTGRAPLSS